MALVTSVSEGYVFGMENIQIQRADAKDAMVVGALVNRLLCELVPHHYHPKDIPERQATAATMLEQGAIWGFLARDRGEAMGVLTLHEGHAIYAGGAFGEISELYVTPEYRSLKVGEQLIEAASTFARDRGWTILEVGTAEQPKWQRSLEFYIRQGFTDIGSRLELNI